jgi:DnaJ-class molecular chaperone
MLKNKDSQCPYCNGAGTMKRTGLEIGTFRTVTDEIPCELCLGEGFLTPQTDAMVIKALAPEGART